MSAAIVFGSLNLDYVVRLPHTPNGGETVTATELALVPGGKGANQAVALARMGTVAQLIGCTGDDAAGEFVRNALAAERIGLEGIRRVAEMPTGSAFIFVEPSGQNRIAVVPGANAAVGERELERLAAALPGAQALLLQLEVPLDAVVRAARMARAAGVRVILDPAPARELPSELRGALDILTPNESEAAFLTGRAPNDAVAAAACATELHERYRLEAAIVKLGARGACVADSDGVRHYPAPRVVSVDTTAAGDAFNGALAAALSAGATRDVAVQRAVAAGALCVTRPGAFPSIPKGPELDAFAVPPGGLNATQA